MKRKFLAAAFLIGAALFATGAANAAQGPDMPDVFPAFSAKDLNGGTVTDAIFADKTLTMVNIWTTWCPPCVNEMPDLGRLGRSMPEGTQLVGIVLDVKDPKDSETISDAKNILGKTKADFLQILPVDAMRPVLGEVAAIPTTIFVNSKGQIVGGALVGSRPEKEYRSEVESILRSMK
ncbi:MAG: TlpA family protein disulfide reductase [Synergistaceae bacterium]|jgi:thiol-disulfide isomerase/thioredoxin|nr:TlpA family protein disulfide reductase [Synergistaceae bacterium]